MGEQKHTKLPWVLCHHLQSAEKDASCPCGYRGGIWGGDGETLVCEMRNCDLHEGHDMIPVGTRAEQLANAHLIVRAVNTYPAVADLVDALELCADELEESVENEGKLASFTQASRKARTALSRFEKAGKAGAQ